MSKNIEDTLKLALEALEKALHYHGVMLLSDPPQDAWKYHRVEQTAHEAITAIKEALTQTEQEPVAWLSEGGNFSFVPYQCSTPLYTTPPQRTAAEGEDTRRAWVGLTDEEINTAASVQSWKPFAKAIEAKLKEKNT